MTTFSSVGTAANIQSPSTTLDWTANITPGNIESQIGYSLHNEYQTWKTVGIVFIVLFAIFAIATIILMIIWISAKPPPTLTQNNPNLNSSLPILDPSTNIASDKQTGVDTLLNDEEENADDVARVLMESFENEPDLNSNNEDEDDNFNSAKLLNNSVLTKTQAKKMIHNNTK